MTVDTSHRAFVGDGERDLCLTPPMIAELERLRETGIGALYLRLAAYEFRFDDIVQTIRLGLVGGGLDPQAAAALVETYVSSRPISESFPVAVGVLKALFKGPDAAPPEGEGAA